MNNISGNYLSNIVKGAFKQGAENRLTKIFCATFNSSKLFRVLFLDFIHYKKDRNVVAKDQYSPPSHTANLLDIVIVRPTLDGDIDVDNIKILIENKVDAPFSNAQIKRYNKTEVARKIKNKNNKVVLVRDYFENYNVKWSIKHWSDLYHFIKKSKEYAKLIQVSRNSIDEFLISNFLNYLKDNNMDIVPTISNADLNNLNLLFNVTQNIRKRFEKRAYPSQRKRSFSIKQGIVFDTAKDYISMLKGIFNYAKQETIIKKRVMRNYQFHTRFSYWLDSEKDISYPSLYFPIRLSRVYRNMKEIGTFIAFEEKSYVIYVYAVDSENSSIDNKLKIFHVKKSLEFDEYSNFVIKYWKKWLK